jgi:endonuclease/exonuclease/phosphatase family metal-dependent hydrolase
MTYNIKSGRHHPDGLAAIARIVEAQSPDILALQEVDEGMARSAGLAQTDWLTRRLRMRGLFAPAMPYDGGWYGIALLSHWPVESHECRPLFCPTYPDAASRPRHDSEPRVMLSARVSPPPDSPDTPARVNVIVTHLGLTPDQRTVQVRELAEQVAHWADAGPTLVVGDFNCEPDAPELSPLRERLRDACAARGVAGEDRFTFPSGSRGARTSDGWRGAIDYVWVSPDLSVLSARVLADESRASDHQPLVVDLEWVQ